MTDMKKQELLDKWIAEEKVAHIQGWDFHTLMIDILKKMIYLGT